MDLTKILLIFGGESSEHDISIMSAKNVFDALDKSKFSADLCFIDKEGGWWLVDDISKESIDNKKRVLLPKLGQSKFVVLPDNYEISPKVLLPILHGINGEDGTVQGLAKLLHIPVVGCGVAASAIAMDKVLAKEILEQNGIKTTPYIVHCVSDQPANYQDIAAKLSSELFIKPANGGSSVGVSKVSNQAELDAAMTLAHSYCSKVLIEKAMKARELEVGALESSTGIDISLVGEIKADREFYDFDSKYDESSSSAVEIPALIDSETMETIRKMAKDAFVAIDGNGMARIDFFLVEDGTIYLNEINTIPGFTNISMYPKLWQDRGVSYQELITRLIYIAK